MAAVITQRIAGLVWHMIRHRENIALAMVTGRKEGKVEDAIPSGHARRGMLILILAGAWITVPSVLHDVGTDSVNLPGTGVQAEA